MCHDLCFWTWSRLSSTKSEREHIGSCSILSSSYLASRTQPTTSQEVTTLWAKRSSICVWIAYESWLINVQDYRVLLFTIRWEVEQVRVFVLCFHKDFLLIMEKKLSLAYQYILHQSYQLY
jgi:hypothetical protein